MFWISLLLLLCRDPLLYVPSLLSNQFRVAKLSPFVRTVMSRLAFSIQGFVGAESRRFPTFFFCIPNSEIRCDAMPPRDFVISHPSKAKKEGRMTEWPELPLLAGCCNRMQGEGRGGGGGREGLGFLQSCQKSSLFSSFLLFSFHKGKEKEW